MAKFHEQLADWLIENGGTKGSWMHAAQRYFGVHPEWLAMVYYSDAFQDYWARRLQAGEKPRNKFKTMKEHYARRR